MKKQSEKQSLASHRNWFKFKLAGMYFPFQKEALTDDEKWDKIQELRKELIESFNENSIKKGLKVNQRCICGRIAKYPNNREQYWVEKYPLVCKKHFIDYPSGM